MKTKYLFLSVFVLLLLIHPAIVSSGSASGTTNSSLPEDTIQWFNATQFKVLGQAWSNLKNPYDRLPAKAENKVRPPLWRLSTHSAGLAIYFSSNSTTINVRWSVRYNTNMAHMAATGIKGVDLYAWNEGRWQFVNNGRPSGKDNDAKLISGKDDEWKEYLLYLPLYDGVDSLSIGIIQGSEIVLPEMNKFPGKPIVFYGTSITQGGCASRPGMAYTSIISRKLGREVINLGFSGNGRMEQELSELMTEIDAACYIIDCLPNLTASQVKERTISFVESLRKVKPDIPVLLVESTLPETAFLDNELREEVDTKNKNLFSSFEQLQDRGISRIYFIPSEKLLGYDHEATVDGVHYTELGFMRYAERLIKYLEGILE